MVLSERQLLLLDFVKLQHGEQKRKYTHEPYWNHVYSVAEIVSEYAPVGIEMALCHDLLEDTPCTTRALSNFLMGVGYSFALASDIVCVVQELSDKFTKERYPLLNRKERKKKECERMAKISSLAQTVKYADILHNTVSIVEHDKGFAKVYLAEIKEMLSVMRGGNKKLLNRCDVIEDACLKLSSVPITN